jgi:cellulose synthase/poly-beta-1,6-N-acetylglucosamine synthase-like glycosyltransferase
MNVYEAFIVWGYFGCLVVLSLFGMHRYVLTGIFLKTRRQAPALPAQAAARVTVQLPIFNERYVVERLIDAVAALDWPADCLQIQVLDDSTDETTALARAAVARWREAGVDISLRRREDRAGFKAGALEAGLAEATGEFVAVFDADFLPPPDFLKQVMPHFSEGVGMVQARWGHLNNDYSLLTRLQAVLLDGHFVIEHTARNRSGRFFNFNGTAGVWRTRCIRDAGGWQHDTLTEDLDLSYRAQMAGWGFVYLPGVVTPAELPVSLSAFKSQQHRWAKGSIQTALKLLPRILRSPQPAAIKLEAVAHLTANLAYPLMMLVALLIPPSLLVRWRWQVSETGWLDVTAFVLASLSVGVFYTVSQVSVYRDWRRRVALIPAVMALGIGMGVNQTRAVFEALAGRTSPFVRTPKSGVTRRGERRAAAYRLRLGWGPLLEGALSLYHLAGIGLAVSEGYYLALPFQLLFCLGFGYVGFGTIIQELRGARPARAAAGA